MESIYHIETDLECKVLHYGNELCIATPGQDVSIKLRMGRHKLTFISTENPQVAYTIFYEVPGNDIEDFIEVDLKSRCIARVRARFDEAAVDLGLSVKWSSFNLGASRAEDYGDYYAWGESEPYYKVGHSLDNPCNDWKEWKTGYNWASYKWSKDNHSRVTKYCPVSRSHYWSGSGSPDGKTILDPEDDAAHVNLGGGWRLPTPAEWSELSAKCKLEWTALDGVKGCKFTGPNGNSIFLPFAGTRRDADLHGSGSWGDYWSSSLDLYSPDSADNTGFGFLLFGYSYGRYCGRSVRPVKE